MTEAWRNRGAADPVPGSPAPRGRWKSLAPAVLLALVTVVSGCSSSNAATTASITTTSSTTTAPTTTTVTAIPPTTEAGGTIAAGSVTCSSVTGTVSFDPPLTSSGTSPETISLSLTSTGCTATGSAAQVTGNTTTATIQAPTNDCTSLLNSQPAAVAVTWSPSSVHASVVSYSGYSIVSAPTTGNVGLGLPNGGGTASVTGSFPGADKGAKSTLAIYFNVSSTQVLGICAATGGLSSLTAVSGTITLS